MKAHAENLPGRDDHRPLLMKVSASMPGSIVEANTPDDTVATWQAKGVVPER